MVLLLLYIVVVFKLSICRCPGPHKCRSETLLKYNKHLEETGHDKTLQETPVWARLTLGTGLLL